MRDRARAGELAGGIVAVLFPADRCEEGFHEFQQPMAKKVSGRCLTLAGRMESKAPGKDALELMNAKQEERWESFVARYGPLIPAPLPAKLGEASFLCFEPDWTPVLLKMRASSEDSASG